MLNDTLVEVETPIYAGVNRRIVCKVSTWFLNPGIDENRVMLFYKLRYPVAYRGRSFSLYMDMHWTMNGRQRGHHSDVTGFI